MRSHLKLLAAALIAGSATVSLPAAAQATWNYANFTQSSTNADNFANSWSYTQGGTTLTVTGFGQGSGSAFSTGSVGNYGSGSGFGVKNQTEGLNVTQPQHSMDNFVGIDMLALHFTSATNAEVNVVMTQLATGWHNTDANATCTGSSTGKCGTDSDISLLRWTKSTGPTITGGTAASLLAAGWELVNHYDNMVDDTGRSTGLTGSSAGSSWWLISSYSSAWGTGTSSSTTNLNNLSNGDDFVKVLASVTTLTVPKVGVPEPASLALVAVALLGAAGSRRVVARRR